MAVQTMARSSEPSNSTDSGMRSKKAAPIRMPAPTAMIAPTERVARAATMPPNRADMKAPTDTRIAVASM